MAGERMSSDIERQLKDKKERWQEMEGRWKMDEEAAINLQPQLEQNKVALWIVDRRETRQRRN